MKEPGTDGEAGIPAPGADGQAFPFFGVLAAVASLALAVVFPLIKPLAWSVLLSFSVYPLFEKMREGPFRRRSDGFSAAAATGMIVLFAVIPCIFVLVLALREGVRLHGFVLEVLAAMESTGEGALATLLPEWLVEHIRPWMVRYPAIRGWVRETAARGAVEAVSAAGDAALFLYYVSIITVSCFFLLRDGKYIVSYLREIVPLPPDQAAGFFDRGNRTLQAVVYGVLLTALVQGAAGGLGWLIAGLPNPVLFGALMTFFCPDSLPRDSFCLASRWGLPAGSFGLDRRPHSAWMGRSGGGNHRPGIEGPFHFRRRKDPLLRGLRGHRGRPCRLGNPRSFHRTARDEPLSFSS